MLLVRSTYLIVQGIFTKIGPDLELRGGNMIEQLPVGPIFTFNSNLKTLRNQTPRGQKLLRQTTIDILIYSGKSNDGCVFLYCS